MDAISVIDTLKGKQLRGIIVSRPGTISPEYVTASGFPISEQHLPSLDIIVEAFQRCCDAAPASTTTPQH